MVRSPQFSIFTVSTVRFHGRVRRIDGIIFRPTCFASFQRKEPKDTKMIKVTTISLAERQLVPLAFTAPVSLLQHHSEMCARCPSRYVFQILTCMIYFDGKCTPGTPSDVDIAGIQRILKPRAVHLALRFVSDAQRSDFFSARGFIQRFFENNVGGWHE